MLFHFYASLFVISLIQVIFYLNQNEVRRYTLVLSGNIVNVDKVAGGCQTFQASSVLNVDLFVYF